MFTAVKSDPEKQIAKDSKGNDVATGNIIVKITYTDGVNTFAQEIIGNDITEDYISKVVAQRINALNAAIEVLTNVASGEVVPISPTPPNPQQVEFELASRVYITAKQLLPVDHPDIIIAQDKMLAVYKQEYIGL